MSSATSTDAAEQVRLKADPTSSGGRPQSDQGLQPWQFFVLAALACATAVTFLARGQGPTAVILLSVLMGATALAGLAALRAILPLLSSAQEDRPAVVGQRARATLEREKTLALRAIKELEFDKAMGKVSEEDFREMSGRLRSRAARLMRQLDAGAGYRERIERDLAKRLGEKATPGPQDQPSLAGDHTRARARSRRSGEVELAAEAQPADAEGKVGGQAGVRTCAKCATANDTDARFCKQCGTSLV
jgi:hypothetical protein